MDKLYNNYNIIHIPKSFGIVFIFYQNNVYIIYTSIYIYNGMCTSFRRIFQKCSFRNRYTVKRIKNYIFYVY